METTLSLPANCQSSPSGHCPNPPPKGGKWSPQEDQNLLVLIEEKGEKNWSQISHQMAGRNRIQCLQRWARFLRPGLKKGHWTAQEDARLR